MAKFRLHANVQVTQQYREYSNKQVIKVIHSLQVINRVTEWENTTFNNTFAQACRQVYIVGKAVVQFMKQFVTTFVEFLCQVMNYPVFIVSI